MLGNLHPEEVAGRIAVLRIDTAVPPKAADGLRDEKLKTALASLDFLLSAKARVAVLCHHHSMDCSVEAHNAAGQRLSHLLGKPVEVLDDCRGPHVREKVERIAEGQALLLGNLSLEPAEESNDPLFARFLADLGDLYCNEAFSLAQDVRASTVGAVTMAAQAVAGLEFERMLSLLSKTLDHPKRPFLVIIGGKLSVDKLLLVECLTLRSDVDTIMIGGEVSLAFLKAEGRSTGAASVPKECVQIASRMLARSSNADRLVLPQDFIPVDIRKLEDYGLDAGPLGGNRSSPLLGDIGFRTRRSWTARLSSARTILWYGPLGLCEIPA
jgi:phosphoglycerate kinase